MLEREDMNDAQLMRYHRQIMLPEFDVAGQERLRRSQVLVVGLGGLGCPVALYLAAAGVGELILVDPDRVEVSNIQRQIAHTEQNVGQLKVESAAESVRAINPEVKVTVVPEALDERSAAKWVSVADAVVDCTDNFATRELINAEVVKQGRIVVSGAAIRFEGQLSVFDMRRDDSPCYHCLYGAMGDTGLTCSEAGVMSPVVGIIGAAQALETIKVLTGTGEPLVGQLQVFDGLSHQWRRFRLKRDPACPVCAGRRLPDA
ncbi:molybdopterin-synthase adenylyltransferase MoeB [Hahella sp. SMD15-11]|uniref:Molybdopterin-synthase adenylyltransferase n=1 Tax=Thermohahella caldifontis TaxID=3142973 RepID=A0AB39UWN8_9GAMM